VTFVHPRRRGHRLPADAYGPGQVFSVTIGTARRAPVFADLEFGRECVDLLRMTAAPSSFSLFAYCLMPDHAHVLIGIESGTLLAFVREWKSRCYLARCRRGLRDQFWQRSFWDHALRNVERLPEVALYILDNPVRAGVGGRPAPIPTEWRRSGSSEMAGGTGPAYRQRPTSGRPVRIPDLASRGSLATRPKTVATTALHGFHDTRHAPCEAAPE